MVTDLASLPAGRSGVVVRFAAGRGLAQKLDALGLRPGKRLRKLSSQLMAGPVTVLVDGREVAMGRGIARAIYVETEGAA